MEIKAYHVQLFFVLLGAFGNGICMTVIVTQQVYSYASLMVQDFSMADSRSTTGYFAGLLTCAMMAGRTVSSPFWGYVTDSWGRKPVLLLSIFFTMTFSIVFGFSVNYWMAISIRVVIGLLAPVGLVTKTLVSEIVPEQFQAGAMALYSTSWLTGSVVGSIVGGLLVDPKSSGLATSGFFTDWPYLLPNLFTAVISLISLIGVWVWLQETIIKTTDKSAPLLIKPEPTQSLGYTALVKDHLVMRLALLYGLNSFINTGYNELFPLWCWANRNEGGLSFSPADIGWALAGSNIVLVILQQYLFQALSAKKGVKWCTTCGSLAMAPVAFIIPWISYSNNTFIIWVYIIGTSFIFFFLNFQVLTAQFILSNNCVFKAERGKLNGLYMLIGSFSRSLAPLLAGIGFAATANSGLPFPIDFTFCFSVMSGLCLLMWWFSREVPVHLEHPKESATAETGKVYTEETKSQDWKTMSMLGSTGDLQDSVTSFLSSPGELKDGKVQQESTIQSGNHEFGSFSHLKN